MSVSPARLPTLVQSAGARGDRCWPCCRSRRGARRRSPARWQGSSPGAVVWVAADCAEARKLMTSAAAVRGRQDRQPQGHHQAAQDQPNYVLAVNPGAWHVVSLMDVALLDGPQKAKEAVARPDHASGSSPGRATVGKGLALPAYPRLIPMVAGSTQGSAVRRRRDREGQRWISRALSARRLLPVLLAHGGGGPAPGDGWWRPPSPAPSPCPTGSSPRASSSEPRQGLRRLDPDRRHLAW